MKKRLAFLVLSVFIAQSYGQDPNPDLFQTWYLASYSDDLGETHYLTDVEPFLSIDMTIDDQLGFTGLACNEYGGEFLYDTTTDRLELVFFDLCLCGTCNNPPPSHVSLENDYFDYFFGQEGSFYEYVLSTDSGTGIMGLALESIPGFTLEYQNAPVLGTSDFKTTLITMSPNPVSETLFITTEGASVEEFSIYSIGGERVVSKISVANQIDVSGLNAGLYFAEITTSEGTSIQKFIKQ